MKGEAPTILLIEDNPDHVELITRCFEDHIEAARIFHVSDGEAALDYLFRRGAHIDPQTSPRPNLVVLDLRLPKLDGLSVLAGLRASDEFASLPVIVLTTSEVNTDIARAYDRHVNSYLVKPVDYEAFSEMMRAMALYWIAWNRYPES